MSDAKRTKNYIVHKLRKSYREGKLDTSQVARLKAIGFDFEGSAFCTPLARWHTKPTAASRFGLRKFGKASWTLSFLPFY